MTHKNYLTPQKPGQCFIFRCPVCKAYFYYPKVELIEQYCDICSAKDKRSVLVRVENDIPKT
jgi:hypothetical protein